MSILAMIFWGMVALIIYTYVGFFGLLWLRTKLMPQSYRADINFKPKVSFLIAAYNEADVILSKINNLLALDYPEDLVEIVIASDGSDDGTNEIIKQNVHPRVKLLELPRQGKNDTINSAIDSISNDIIVFSDADTLLKSDALTHLIAPLVDDRVGAVSGDFHYQKSSAEGAQSEKTYWSIDRVLKQLQSDAGTMTSTSGQLYALRRELFSKVPQGVTDDFFLSTQAPANHLRLIFEPKAYCYGPPAASTASEFKRKVRIMTRGFNSVWQQRRVLNPQYYGFYALQVFTHKILRRVLIIPLIIMLVTSALLWSAGWIYQVAFLGQLTLHSLAIAGYVLRDAQLGKLKKIISLPLYFDMVYIAALVALFNAMSGKSYSVWFTNRSQVDPA